jgi:hypothetical protein
MEKYPPGYNLMASALKAFRDAGPPPTRPGFDVPEGATLTESLEAFKRWADGDDSYSETNEDMTDDRRR